ncbi:MurR/RpiR family transcriptional regulator [Enterococcus faecalis]|uniref:MurR/RpiR family transcriptional regulator n=1 Tax=Enterococcus faecalis TaxID=1351 RepID=UPI0029C98047|nr:MurR/RpiR family transcriptional regulator [Enterococcus faecalis]WPH42637.1 MurR/RpiR family transcriptional regulator [Enterococcus faecalis]
MNIEELINEQYNYLSPTEKSIAQYISNHKTELKTLSITKLAEKTTSSKASIVRLSQKLGFKGFTELKGFFIWGDQNIPQKLTVASKSNILSSLEDTIDYLKNTDWSDIYSLIDNCEKIYVIYTGVSQKNQTFEMERLFLFIGKPVLSIPADNESYEFKHFFNVLGQNDLVFIISLTGNNKNLIDVLNLLSLKRTKTISLTGHTDNLLSQRADYRLYASRFKDVSVDSLQSNSMFYVVIEALVFGYLEYKNLT